MSTTDYQVQQKERQQEELLQRIRRLERELEQAKSQLATIQHDLRRLWEARKHAPQC